MAIERIAALHGVNVRGRVTEHVRVQELPSWDTAAAPGTTPARLAQSCARERPALRELCEASATSI